VGKPGLKKVHRYSVEFKLTAVKLSYMPGVEVQTVANALDIHPFCRAGERKCVTACSGAERDGSSCPHDRRARSSSCRL
jgi:hypothetical protein